MSTDNVLDFSVYRKQQQEKLLRQQRVNPDELGSAIKDLIRRLRKAGPIAHVKSGSR